MAILLDTDHISILQYPGPAAAAIEHRLTQISSDAVRVCIVSFQEQARGWLAVLHRARKRADVLKAFSNLQVFLRFYRARAVLPFDEAAMDEFERLQRQRIRIGTNDLRIAAIAKANGVKLLSRNLRDFRQVPGLDVEDWTV